MFLVQILLPLQTNEGEPIGDDVLRSIRTTLTDRFGGLTAYTHAPAEGIWKDEGRPTKDHVVILEVMTQDLDRTWWRNFREELETKLGQEELVVRSETVERL